MNRVLRKIKKLIKIIIFNPYLFLCGLYIRIFKVKYLLFLAPYHGNLGDHAILLSEKQFLEEKKIKAFEISTKAFDLCGKLFAKLIPKTSVILIHGGGFMGSLWKHEEIRLRKVLNFFPHNKIIVFPQTVTFSFEDENDLEFFNKSKEIYSVNKQLTVFVREEKSYQFMLEKMPEVAVKKAPDIVTRFKIDNINILQRNGIVFCFRKDHEKNITDDLKSAIIESVKDKFGYEDLSFTDTVINRNISRLTRKKVVNAKLREFAGSKLVITDRLHGMIMAAVTNTPCIAFGNTNGKVKNVYFWIKNNGFIRYVDTYEQFEDALNTLDLTKAYKYHIDESLFSELNTAIEDQTF